MGLILGVKAGEKIYIADDWIRVVKVTGPHNFVLENEDGTAYTIKGAQDQPQEVLPEVFVSAGVIRSDMPGRAARVFITAPKEMQILRQGPYRTLTLYEDSVNAIEGLLEMMAMPAAEIEADVNELLTELKDEIKLLTRGGKR